MKKLLFSSLFCLISFLFTGCIAAAISDARMPKETVNIKDYNSDTVSNPEKVDLFLFMSRALYTTNATIFIDDNASIYESLSFSYYLYFQVEPGLHWITVKDHISTMSYYTCKNMQAGTKEIVDLARPMTNVTTSDMDITNSGVGGYPRSQIKQKTNEIPSTFGFNGKLNSANIEIVPTDNKELIKLQKIVGDNFQQLSIPKGDDLTIQISFPNNPQTGRFDTTVVMARMKSVKLEFFRNNEKIGQHFHTSFYDELEKDNSNHNLAANITSYIACKYFGKQYPIYKQ